MQTHNGMRHWRTGGKKGYGDTILRRLVVDGLPFLSLNVTMALQPNVDGIFLSKLAPVESVGWYGVVAPAGTPPDIIKRLNVEFTAILTSPDVKQRITDLGGIEVPLTAQHFSNLIGSEIDKWATVIKAAGIKVD